MTPNGWMAPPSVASQLSAMSSGRPAAVAQRERDLAGVRPHRQPVAADADRLAGDPRRRVGGEEHDERRAVLGHADRVRLAHLARQRPRPPRRARRAARRPGCVAVIAVHAVGTIALTVISARASSIAQVAANADDAGLGGGVVRLAEVAALAGRRADDDDPAALALLAHADRRGARARERAAQVRVDDEVEVLVGHLPQHAVAQDAGVGDHDVEAAELAHRAGDERVRGLAVSPTGAISATARPPARGDRRDGLVGGVAVDVVDDDGCARGGERHRVRAAEARGRCR